MATVPLTTALRGEYQTLFDTCLISPGHAADIDRVVTRITASSARYSAVGKPLGIPWQFVGVTHCMEASLDFRSHLHNGDPLTARTRQVPAGRPKDGEPPFTWEVSARDALRLKKLDRWTDWSVPGVLYRLEGYNGFGYRLHHPEVNSPYLWSFSNHYTSGKYVADGTWSASAVSKQCGAAVLLRRIVETGAMRFDATDTYVPDDEAPDLEDLAPLVRYSPNKRSVLAEQLQCLLNGFPGVYVRVDGIAGPRTSDAFHRVTGHYLQGDPRASSLALRRSSSQRAAPSRPARRKVRGPQA